MTTDLNPDLRYWQQRAAKLEAERDEARQMLRAAKGSLAIASGNADERRRGYRDGKACVETNGVSPALSWVDREMSMRDADNEVREAWWRLGYVEAHRDAKRDYWDERDVS